MRAARYSSAWPRFSSPRLADQTRLPKNLLGPLEVAPSVPFLYALSIGPIRITVRPSRPGAPQPTGPLAAGVHRAAAGHAGRPGARRRRLAARAEVRRLPHPRPARRRQGHAGQPPRQRLDGQVPDRAGGGRGAAAAPTPCWTARWRSRAPTGAPASRPCRTRWARGAGAALYFVFDLLWLDGEDLTGLPLEQRKQRLAKLLAGAAGQGRAAALLRSRGGAGAGVLPAGPGARAGGDHLQAAGRPVPPRPQHRLAEDQVHQPAGVRHRRVHRSRGRPRRASAPCWSARTTPTAS